MLCLFTLNGFLPDLSSVLDTDHILPVGRKDETNKKKKKKQKKRKENQTKKILSTPSLSSTPSHFPTPHRNKDHE